MKTTNEVLARGMRSKKEEEETLDFEDVEATERPMKRASRESSLWRRTFRRDSQDQHGGLDSSRDKEKKTTKKVRVQSVEQRKKYVVGADVWKKTKLLLSLKKKKKTTGGLAV